MSSATQLLDQARSNHRAIFVMCAGVFLLALSDAMAKWLVERYSPFQILFVRSLLALPFIASVVFLKDGLSGFKTARPSTNVQDGFRVSYRIHNRLLNPGVWFAARGVVDAKRIVVSRHKNAYHGAADLSFWTSCRDTQHTRNQSARGCYASYSRDTVLQARLLYADACLFRN